MVKIVSILTVLAMGFALTEAVCDYCQCLQSDGSHCCAAHANGKNCEDICKTANGDYTITPTGLVYHACTGGTSNVCISGWTYAHRHHCV
ncbi:hypothetical protein C8034_v007093 [Colletotrichum sidae]|uniref:Uncharacterized protein n=3 Tax=Colletotrichum orbiculare species complex TaxID=2707354 RepID=A0A484FXS1_COLOR|nr:hypothetical protein Cob_v004294 [Colletotrichum orbiculare MAFF 240422]TDZ39497.1 hypothetical protein CTRI78_v010573 [Colletotrichum trifolii]TEA11964.1 hypothetical protein C8034_v007093 [Colletotrichum sidae]